MKCTNCNRAMDPVELHNVPVEYLKDFLSVDSNKLNDNWYWCSSCDSYDQHEAPKRLSPDEEHLAQLIECYSGFF